MAQDTRTDNTPTPTEGSDSIGGQWLDVQPDPLTSDSLKAKNWQTDARRVDDNAYYGNLHLGSESNDPLLRTDNSEWAQPIAEDSGTVVADESNKGNDVPEEAETTPSTTILEAGTIRREEHKLVEDGSIIPLKPEAFLSPPTPLIEENEAGLNSGSFSDPSAETFDPGTVLLSSKEALSPQPSQSPVNEVPEEVVVDDSELPPWRPQSAVAEKTSVKIW